MCHTVSKEKNIIMARIQTKELITEMEIIIIMRVQVLLMRSSISISMNFFNLWIWEHIGHTILEIKWVVLISTTGLKHIHRLFLHAFLSVLGLSIFVRVVVASVVIERKKIKGKISQKNKAIEIYKEKIDFYYYFWVFISLNILFFWLPYRISYFALL